MATNPAQAKLVQKMLTARAGEPEYLLKRLHPLPHFHEKELTPIHPAPFRGLPGEQPFKKVRT
jgi:hypothetical protein